MIDCGDGDEICLVSSESDTGKTFGTPDDKIKTANIFSDDRAWKGFLIKQILEGNPYGNGGQCSFYNSVLIYTVGL